MARLRPLSVAAMALLVLVPACSSKAGTAAPKVGPTASRVAQLVPAPSVAATQQVVPNTDGCEVGIRSNANSGECRYLPNSGHGDVVLVGDSHAAQWFPAVYAIAAQQHWGLRVWVKASCPIADIDKVLDGKPSTSCDAWRDDVLRRLVADKPDLVIVASYASVVPATFDRSTGKLEHGVAAQALYRAGMASVLRKMRGAGSKVLLVRDNPSFAMKGPQCVLAHPTDLAKCSEPKTEALPSSADLDGAREVPGVRTVDFTDKFCNAKRCYQVLGTTLAYRDQGHLSGEVTRLLQPELAAAAIAALSH